MMEISLDTNMFPQLRDGVRARWAPVFFEPISGSYERFVVGVAAFNDQGFHLEWANQLERLSCFYGANARGAISAIQIAGDYLQDDLAKRAGRAIGEPDPAVSGIAFGDTREAEGNSLEGIAQSWMAALSSLYQSGMAQNSRARELVEVAAETEGSGDRLPFLVCDYVKSKRVGFADFFSADLRENRQRRAKRNTQEPVIDFSGSRLVANFGTLKAASLSRSFELVKLRLWDLDTVQVRDRGSMAARKYEMILQRPAKDDPQVSDKQQSRLEEALKELEEQADDKQLRLRPLETYQKIGDHVLKAEAA
ncbi:hypothetical protein [Alloyangia pacifica]|uniref:hypothetical protein n=1 Tax=Alloyangia pacifica TaxID=311180 RepID=UPI001CD653CE|nr:hypothetical protein [Alloyangia pacifica]MCA0997956.1 hypothetical protein [Alloyangia pacifica]